MLSKLADHFTDELAVMPFFFLDGSDSIFLFWVFDGLPMPLIRVCGGEFTGVRQLKDSYKKFTTGSGIHFESLKGRVLSVTMNINTGAAQALQDSFGWRRTDEPQQYDSSGRRNMNAYFTNNRFGIFPETTCV